MAMPFETTDDPEDIEALIIFVGIEDNKTVFVRDKDVFGFCQNEWVPATKEDFDRFSNIPIWE